MPPLQIQHKAILVFAEHPQPYCQCDCDRQRAVQIGDGCRRATVQDDGAHEENDLVQRIHVEDRDQIHRDNALGIEDGGQEVQHGQRHPPQEGRVPEEHVQRGQNQRHPEAEKNQVHHHHRQQEHALVEGHPGDQHHNHQRNEGNAQVDG